MLHLTGANDWLHFLKTKKTTHKPLYVFKVSSGMHLGLRVLPHPCPGACKWRCLRSLDGPFRMANTVMQNRLLNVRSPWGHRPISGNCSQRCRLCHSLSSRCCKLASSLRAQRCLNRATANKSGAQTNRGCQFSLQHTR